MLVLFLILWDMRAALIVALLLPMTAAAAFLLMGWQGVTANLMSLGGLAIAIGMVVDGAIVITENISRHMREKAGPSQSRLEIAYEAAREVIRPVAFVFLIIIIVLPAAVLAGVDRRQDVQAAGPDDDLRPGRLAGHHADGDPGPGRDV